MSLKLRNQNLNMPTKRLQWKDLMEVKKNIFTAIEMMKFMRSNNGIGLAANQVGIRKSIFVMEIDGNEFYIFDPQITGWSKDEIIMEEGCLSFPGKKFKISRPESITVLYQTVDPATIKNLDLAGSFMKEICVETELTGLAARCFQHEFDHLQGITFDQKKVID